MQAVGRNRVQRLLLALDTAWGLRNLKCDWPVLPDLQVALRKGKWQVTVAVYKDEWVIAVWPGFKRDAYGLAIDIGSTTIAANLINLTNGNVIATDGIMNPQIRFGEDLMSRVSYVMMNPAGAIELTNTVREGINKLIASLARTAGVETNEIVDVTIAGNPIMHHLFLGISPVELGSAPFALATDAALDLRALEVGLDINKGATVYVLPCIAGHVGADAAAMILPSTAPLPGVDFVRRGQALLIRLRLKPQSVGRLPTHWEARYSACISTGLKLFLCSRRPARPASDPLLTRSNSVSDERKDLLR